jgi:hypothetical protein
MFMANQYGAVFDIPPLFSLKIDATACFMRIALGQLFHCLVASGFIHLTGTELDSVTVSTIAFLTRLFGEGVMTLFHDSLVITPTRSIRLYLVLEVLRRHNR